MMSFLQGFASGFSVLLERIFLSDLISLLLDVVFVGDIGASVGEKLSLFDFGLESSGPGRRLFDMIAHVDVVLKLSRNLIY